MALLLLEFGASGCFLTTKSDKVYNFFSLFFIHSNFFFFSVSLLFFDWFDRFGYTHQIRLEQPNRICLMVSILNHTP